MRLPAYLAHRAERRADQARVTVLSDLLFVAAFVLTLAAVFVS